jgi:ABC-type sugar transport system ATPase subunit
MAASFMAVGYNIPPVSGLEFQNIQKSFGAVRALAGVSFNVAEGEAHALMGENGAGKSTLLKILAGIVRPDAGEIRWRGELLHATSPRDAIERGIGMVYQEMLSFPTLSVSANIFAGREICGPGGLLREDEMRARTRELLGRLQLEIDPDAAAETLSIAHRQMLQVARALAFKCQILVLDEPTTALTDSETDHLFDVLRDLKQQGTTLLYVSHRIPEVFRLCDRITVLRDGEFVATLNREEVTHQDVVKGMVGREIKRIEHTQRTKGQAILKTDSLSRPPYFKNVSLSVSKGEIVGLFGLVGSGRSELLETCFGIHQASSGDLNIAGSVALVPEERQRQGLFFNLSVGDNLVIPKHAMTGGLLIHHDEEARETSALIDEWRIKTPGASALPDQLSGGNQQKVVIAKWLATRPSVLLLDEPTKGVDVGAKFEIHEMIRKQAAEGLAVLVVSSDLPEILALADRVIVMREGRVQGEIEGAVATEESVMHLATA